MGLMSFEMLRMRVLRQSKPAVSVDNEIKVDLPPLYLCCTTNPYIGS